jgi:hypothetical protein
MLSTKRIVIVSLLVLAPSAAAAQEEEGEIGDLVPGPPATEAYAREVNSQARGLGIGIDQGFWGSGFAQGIHLDIPFPVIGQFVGVRARGLVAWGPFDATEVDPALFGGVEFFGRSPVVFGLARIYGGGGVHIGGRPHPTTDTDTFGVSGGGHLGVEVFGTPWMAYAVEVGGQGNVHGDGIDAGASIMGAVRFYVGAW